MATFRRKVVIKCHFSLFPSPVFPPFIPGEHEPQATLVETYHTHSVWTHSSQGQIINEWQYPLIPELFSGGTCGSYGNIAALRRRNSPTAHTCTGITSAGSSAENAILA